jgi:hypothetical protein
VPSQETESDRSAAAVASVSRVLRTGIDTATSSLRADREFEEYQSDAARIGGLRDQFSSDQDARRIQSGIGGAYYNLISRVAPPPAPSPPAPSPPATTVQTTQNLSPSSDLVPRTTLTTTSSWVNVAIGTAIVAGLGVGLYVYFQSGTARNKRSR